MDAYVVGSVADFILKKKHSNKKSKEHLKVIDREQVSDINYNTAKNLEFTVNDFNLKNQNKFKKTSRACRQSLEENVSIKKVKLDSLIKSPKDKIEPSVRKRIKLLEEPLSSDNCVRNTLNKKKSKINLPDLDHIPSDSEEDEVENIRKISENNNKISSKLIDKKDFKENTVFVGNFPINYDKKKIHKVFSKCGEIHSTRIRCVPIADINISKKVAAIKKKFNPKRNSLVAYVKFKSQESVDAALKYNGMIIDGHHLRVDTVEENKDRDNNKAVFVGGLPFDIEDDDLWDFFQNCGKINSVRIIRDSQTSMGKGFGYVNFDSTASVELALQMNGQELKKRTINVKRCIKTKNKNKLNSFGKKKSKEMTNQLLCKKSKKFKEERKKLKKDKNLFPNDFQGKKANIKQKKKKKLSKTALHQRKLVRILNPS